MDTSHSYQLFVFKQLTIGFTFAA